VKTCSSLLYYKIRNKTKEKTPNKIAIRIKKFKNPEGKRVGDRLKCRVSPENQSS
jgi:hypothetical protein